MKESEVALEIIWPDADQHHVLRANAFMAQFGWGSGDTPEEFILVAGYAAPPTVLGTPEEQQAMLAAMGGTPAKTIARMSMSRQRLNELVAMLSAVANQWNADEEAT